MFPKKEISVYDFVRAISEAVDLVSPVLSKHHQKAAYIAGSIALKMRLPAEDIQDIILAAMLHDIGAFSMAERMRIQAFGYNENEDDPHALLGHKLIAGFGPLAGPAKLIKFHHIDYNSSRHNIPLGSYILHLADRVTVLIDERREILGQVPEIAEAISSRRYRFHPQAFEAFCALSGLEYFWLDIASQRIGDIIARRVRAAMEVIDIGTFRSFAKILAHIIDFRSRFTSTHSSGVAAVARELTVLAGFTEREYKLIEIAGFLHDLGKLAVPNEILEKPGPLDSGELNYIKKHSYYTYHILNSIDGLNLIPAWAAYHHERVDGNGYPFHIYGEDFSKAARTLVVADIITALTEDRPYRRGMDGEKAMQTLLSMAGSGMIDKGVADLANGHFEHINAVRVQAQEEARKEYAAFHHTVM